MRKSYSLLASLSVSLLLISGCASDQPKDEALYHDSKPSTTNEQTTNASKKTDDELSNGSDSQETEEQLVDDADDTSATPTADNVMADVTVSGSTWEEQASDVSKQLDDSEIATIRDEIIPATESDSDSDVTMETGEVDASQSSGVTTTPSNDTADITVPDQTANRLIIAKVNGIDIHTLDQYSDADILAARQAAEAIGADAGYSYQYLLNQL